MNVEEKINDNTNNIQENSYGINLLKSINGDSIRWYNAVKFMSIIVIIVLFMFFTTIGYLVYVLNDTGTIEETETITQENENGYNNYIGNDGDITNGETNNKENN